jgi:hypothetical protein
LCRGGSCNQERAWERIAKAHFPARGFKADDAPLDFLASILIFRVLPKETQGRSQFGTPTQNIPELGIWENKVRQARHVIASAALCPSGARPRPGGAGVYSRKGIHVTIKQPPQKDDRTPRVVIADESRNALKMGRFTASPHCERRLGLRYRTLFPLSSNDPYIYNGQGQYAKAEPLFQRALAIFQNALGPESL